MKIADAVVKHIPADFSGDGTSDMVWKHTSGDFAIWQLAGKQLTSSTSMPMLDPDWVIHGFGDFSGDGKADIVLRHTVMGDVALWEMDGATVTNGAALLQVTDMSWPSRP